MLLRIIIFSLTMITFFGCDKVELDRIKNLNNNRIQIIGHGGSGFQSINNQLPHNSFTSVVNAVEQLGTDGVEIDIQISKDGNIFMYHDEKLHTMTDCDDCLYNHDAEYIKKCRFKNNFDVNIFTNEKVTPLEEVVVRFSQRKIKPIILLDVKTILACAGGANTETSIRTNMSNAIAALIIKHSAWDWIYVESDDVQLLQKVRQLNPNIKCILYQPISSETIQVAKENNFFGFVCSNVTTSADQVQMAHNANLFVVLFSVKSRDGVMEAIKKNPDFIETDSILLLQQALNR
jgi:glycerophosphoryl diester phosphodiesterase